MANSATKLKLPARWRNRFSIHPALKLFPEMSAEELGELAEDIEATQLHEPAAIFGAELLDGRARLDVLEQQGRCLFLDDGAPHPAFIIDKTHVRNFDPFSYIVARNLRRRNLSQAQKREIIAKLLVDNPNKSNRSIARLLGFDHKTVASERAARVATGEIPQLLTTIGGDGKERPAFRVVKPAREPVSTPDTSKPIIDINDLRKAWERVEHQFATGNKAALGVALRSLITQATDFLSACDGTGTTRH